jgi:hypothetical protein
MLTFTATTWYWVGKDSQASNQASFDRHVEKIVEYAEDCMHDY